MRFNMEIRAVFALIGSDIVLRYHCDISNKLAFILLLIYKLKLINLKKLFCKKLTSTRIYLN